MTVPRVADVVGHCVVVFAFVPALAELPRWLAFEAQNPLNRHDPVVATFLPVRGMVLLLNAFAAGLTQGVLGGVVAGLLLCALAAAWPDGFGTPLRRIGLGALGGGVAAALAIGVLMAPRLADAAAQGGRLAFEIVAGMVCGMIAAPTAARLAGADQRPATMASASHQ